MSRLQLTIAHAAGVAVGGFYQHFTSKRQILLVLMDQLLQDVSLLTWEAKGTPPTGLRNGIARLIHQALTVDWTYAGACQAWHEAAVRDLELQELHHQIEAWSASQLTLLFRALSFVPGARPDGVVAILTSLLNHGLFADSPA
jgi:AcrR family transcriptional regulator